MHILTSSQSDDIVLPAAGGTAAEQGFVEARKNEKPGARKERMPGERPILGCLVCVLVTMLGGVGGALAQGVVDGVSVPPMVEDRPIGKAPPPSEIQPITDVLPLWGTTLRDKGVDLPLPFGLGLTYTYINQNTKVYDVEVEGRPLGVSIPDSKTFSHTLVFRADVWVVPIFDVYGLFGYTGGETKPRIRLPNGSSIGSTVNYSRALYGGGATLAGGYQAFFLTLDANYTSGAIQSDKGQIGSRNLFSITFTPRAGANFSAGVLGEGAVWIGGMYMDFAQEIRDSIHLADRNPALPIIVGQDDIDYTVRIRAKDPWNLLLGGNWQVNKRWSIALELGGVLDRFQATGSAMFRF